MGTQLISGSGEVNDHHQHHHHQYQHHHQHHRHHQSSWWLQTRQDLEVATREERARVLQEEEFKANQKLTVDNANLREANKNLRCMIGCP